MKLIKLMSAATLFALAAASLSPAASAAPVGAFHNAVTVSGSGGPAAAAPINNAGATLFGAGTPGATMPVPQPAQLPPLELDKSYAAQHGTVQKTADADLPEPSGAALLLAGLALMGLAARRARAARR